MEKKSVVVGKVLLGFGLLLVGFGCERISDSTISPRISEPTLSLTAEALEKSLSAVNSFVIRDKGGLVFDRRAAVKSGTRAEDIQIGEEITSLANDALQGAQIEREQFQRFEPFFFSVIERSHREEGQGSSKVAIHCPPISEKGVADAKSYLLALGYHPVNRPWTGVPGRDYAKFVNTTHWGIMSFSPFWSYRAQGIVREDNRLIFFQEPEPNPELDQYPWWRYPGTWWGPFVWWWHQSYCGN